jgi:hypothetical protein
MKAPRGKASDDSNRKTNLDGDGTSDDGDKIDSGNTGDRVGKGSIHFDEARNRGGSQRKIFKAPKRP